jgi:hypothetical protein
MGSSGATTSDRKGQNEGVLRRARPLKAIEVLAAAVWIAYAWMDAGSHHFSAGYRLFALVSMGLLVAILLLRAVRLRIGFGRELPGRSPELANDREEYGEAHERRPLGRGWVVAGVAIVALGIGITIAELIHLSI